MNVNELTQLRVTDSATGRIYRLIGFESTGDDRAGLFPNKIVLYDKDNRTRITVTDPVEIKRLTIVKD